VSLPAEDPTTPAARPDDAHPAPAAVLWDMDGTLVDTEPYWIDSEFALVGEHGGSWSMEQAHSLVGSDLRESARRLRTEGGVDMMIDDIVRWLIDRVVVLVRERLPWRPGAEELLLAVRAAGVPCALVTMSWTVLAEEIAAALPAGTFATLVTGDVVARPKPHPDPYLEAVRRLGVAAGQCVALEDSTTGVRSALAAGVPTVGIPYLVELEAAPGLVRVPSLEGRDLAWLARVAARRAPDELGEPGEPGALG
jgi:HAD superfamily hydrolase (TIGR01509 family)